MIKFCFIFALLLSSLTCFANGSDLKSNEMLTVTDVKVTEIERQDVADFTTPFLNPIADVISVIDNLMALGQKILNIIEQGKPVVNIQMAPAISIIPNIDGTNVVLNNMANWSVPRMVSYRLSFTNALGMEVVGFTYTLFFQHHGSYNGHGKYVTNLKVQASDVAAMWGSNFTATSEFVGMSNVGTMEEPIGSGIIQVSYIAKGLLNQKLGSRSFYVDGNGVISPIND